jgi:hypothetical protein
MKKNYSFGIVMMLAMLFASLMAYAQPAELLARYPFDASEGTAVVDVSGNGFDATLSECDNCWTEGTIDGAVEFSGFNYVTLPADVMGMTSNDGSVSFWMNAGEPTSIYTMFWAGDNTTGGGFGAENELHIHLEQEGADVWAGGECSFFIIADPNIFIHSDPAKGGPPGVPPVDPLVLGDNEWHHIAATWGEGFAALYIDGTVMWDTSVYNPTGYELNNMFLGKMANDSRQYIGKMDDFRIYTGVLSSFDVETLANKDFTSIDERSAGENNLSVYPNPAQDNATIRYTAEGGKHVSVDIYSLTGAHMGNVYNGTTVSGENLVNLKTAHFAAGLYLVKLNIDNQVSHTKFTLK